MFLLAKTRLGMLVSQTKVHTEALLKLHNLLPSRIALRLVLVVD
tara:strand:- start:187 stop:318 length:132 start_codon:yes stop_codon:yes gene_type:complete